MQNRHAIAVWTVCVLWLFGSAPSAVAERQELTLANGDRYDGEVIDGVLEGFGRYTWADGKRYEGNFSAGKRQGFGSLTWPNGDRYQGDFTDNQIQGRGVFLWANGDRYEGSFVANRRSGQGVMQWRGGQRYEGTFEAGLMSGQGEYHWSDGTSYKGTFVQDRRSGLGILSYADASVFTGFFLGDRRHGMGVEQRNNSPLSLQRWQEDVLQESQAIVTDPQCRAEDADGAWMVKADDCINGLAHGDGYAVTLTGAYIVEVGRWILGQRIAGERIGLPQPPASPKEVTVPPITSKPTAAATNG
ncbi:MAG: hypothetical protein GWP45_04780 [Proteobacteria bacterium]|jgi:hypothetical protein|nr:hypothetical protein [Pseudomonadota bacterium]